MCWTVICHSCTQATSELLTLFTEKLHKNKKLPHQVFHWHFLSVMITLRWYPSPHSHIHCPMKMRFLECPPDLGQEVYVDEADSFYQEPLLWLRMSFPHKSSLPTHLIMFDVLEKVRRNLHLCLHLLPVILNTFHVFSLQEISVFLEGNNFVRTAEIFHTHFPEGRVGRSIFIYQRHWQTLEQWQLSVFMAKDKGIFNINKYFTLKCCHFCQLKNILSTIKFPKMLIFPVFFPSLI